MATATTGTSPGMAAGFLLQAGERVALGNAGLPIDDHQFLRAGGETILRVVKGNVSGDLALADVEHGQLLEHRKPQIRNRPLPPTTASFTVPGRLTVICALVIFRGKTARAGLPSNTAEDGLDKAAGTGPESFVPGAVAP